MKYLFNLLLFLLVLTGKIDENFRPAACKE